LSRVSARCDFHKSLNWARLVQFDSLAVLNDAAHLDFRTVYNQSVQDNDDSIDPYSDLIIDSKYYDMYTLPSILNDSESPIFLSINIQSLMSKYEELRFFITDMSRKKVSIDVIALQEVWEIQQPELLSIPGFQTIIHKSRTNMRGGGLAFT
jgi:hypothetical protein